MERAVWLRDRLPTVSACINVRPRIRAFGYDSYYVFTSSIPDVESFAGDLLTRIPIARQTEEEKLALIIFVAHSLGGLIVKLISVGPIRVIFRALQFTNDTDTRLDRGRGFGTE